jgi:hypothetical protein
MFICVSTFYKVRINLLYKTTFVNVCASAQLGDPSNIKSTQCACASVIGMWRKTRIEETS